ncbi:hypothetical protein [Brevundimonas goettingensis]|uniref:PRC-barrel domain-containing protein n=1 Tax=Brevundimonas goettingensis TaxID=2774190 RepID=A0A975BZ21_9CAUL|nr:hypothetical protein [Brevundimonas goettingensis]QTC90418.1 hypothetical protein IFJ75_14195 [Brevundimonas goettingensis]
MRTLLLTTAAAALAIAVPASAQIVGGSTGQVGAQVGVGVGLPQTAPITGQVGTTVRGATDMTRSTVRDARSAASSAADASASASVQSDTQVAADRNGADASLNISTGAMVHGSDGNMLGSVVRLTRNSAGRVESFVVRSADGTLRSVPASGASVQGDAVVTAWSSGEFNRAPPVQ